VAVAEAFLGFAVEVATEVAFAGSLAAGAFGVMGDLGALLAVLAVETGANVLVADLVALGALVVVVVGIVQFRASLIPWLRTVPPIRVADDSVGLLGSILV
jgi:hypothetical protein